MSPLIEAVVLIGAVVFVIPCSGFRALVTNEKRSLYSARHTALFAVPQYVFGSQRNICNIDKGMTPLQRNLAAYANVVSNDVVNKLITGYEPALNQLKNDFPVFEQEASRLWDKTAHEFDEPSIYNEDKLVQVQSYLRRLAAIASGQWESSESIGEPYDSGILKVLNALLAVKYDPAMSGVPDVDICLSLQDRLNYDDESYDSMQRTLNKVSNCAARAMKHCDLKGRLALADSIEFNLGHKGAYPRGEMQQPQECHFVQSLMSLLREGKSQTDKYITHLGPSTSKKPGTSEISNYIPGISTTTYKVPPRIRLLEPYRTVFYRVLEASKLDKDAYSSSR